MHPGGLGDLVLLSGLLGVLRREWPEAALTLVCRPEVASVTHLYPFALDTIVPLRVNPYEWTTPSRRLVEELRELLGDLAGAPCDLFVAADEPPTWLTVIVGAWLAAPATVASPPPPASRAFIEALMDLLQIKPFAPDLLPAEPQLSELDRYGKILARLGQPAAPRPTLTVGDEARREGEAILTELGVGDERPVACFYSGDAAAALRQPAPQVYVEALAIAAARTNEFALFIGDVGDEAVLELLESDARSLGVRVSRFINRSSSIVPLAAVLSRCRAFLGSDAGLSHVAAALGVPGVTVYGGGTWPRYRVWAPGTIAIVHPLPCFGCGWDCAFGRGVCVESIDRESIATALQRVLELPPPTPEVVECANRPAGELDLIDSVARRYQRTRARDEERRLMATAQLQAERERTRQAEEEIGRLRAQLTNDFQELLASKEAQLQLLAQAASERENLARELGEQLDLKEAELQRQVAAAAERARIIDEFSERLGALENDPGADPDCSFAAIEALRAEKKMIFDTAEERLRALEEAHRALRALRSEGERRAALLCDLTVIVKEREAEIAALRDPRREKLLRTKST
jgi:ADP-heptose:LPS heptosyltransferase